VGLDAVVFTLLKGLNLGAGPFVFWKGPGLELTSSASVMSTHPQTIQFTVFNFSLDK
jgi:hypothetical protein